MICGHCKDCKWWAISISGTFDPNPDEWRSCSKTHMEDGEPIESDTLAYALDRADDAAELYTAPNFGCVQWEAKE